MIGAIIGDIVGSVYEFDNIRTKDFPLFTSEKDYTDDSILTIATADWLLHGGSPERYYWGYAIRHPYPMGSYGEGFVSWVKRAQRGLGLAPYNSCGNGSAMRVGPVGWAFDTEEEILEAARVSAACTHNHPEGIKGAQAVALCIFMARKEESKESIRRAVEAKYGYDLGFTCDEIRPSYTWGATCQDTVPQSIRAFIDGTDFEDCIRNAVSIGGDSDTLACITGSIAEAFYGVPCDMADKAMTYLSDDLRNMMSEFEVHYGNRIIR
ncbi:MAG TPA: ADP-ribosylglycohydrolase family protein [Candidatus Barnesiella excrementipullorum]|uniref:ADP-ribosylglycohydrolase family protein n=1 Tax=Candidatus Barnesiella excrementipullorum TaxID=2838479 RepID=A0A9D2AP66_9BACT|nr:ADP-ribosylglycohydrolase family protein [Candidatus Barnesiella excrementipullorum]